MVARKANYCSVCGTRIRQGSRFCQACQWKVINASRERRLASAAKAAATKRSRGPTPCRCGCGEPAVPPMAFALGHQWRAWGERNLSDPERWARARRKRRDLWPEARRIFGKSCAVCGWDKGRLDLHHMAPEHELRNVILLCPNCHRLTQAGDLSDVELRHAQMVKVSDFSHGASLALMAALQQSVTKES